MTATYQRHPISARYPDIQGRAWEQFLARLKKRGPRHRKIILYEGKILDGWQLYRGCLELDLEPKFAQLPEGEDPEEFVEQQNELRRHESSDMVHRRIDARRERESGRRKDGASIRQIAEEEGVSPSTVQRDLESSTVPGGTVAPPNGKVVGKDGKKRDAKAPRKPKEKVAPMPCARCLRMGSPSCPECREKFPKGFSFPEAGTKGYVDFDWVILNKSLQTIGRMIHSLGTTRDALDKPNFVRAWELLLTARDAFSEWEKESQGGKK